MAYRGPAVGGGSDEQHCSSHSGQSLQTNFVQALPGGHQQQLVETQALLSLFQQQRAMLEGTNGYSIHEAYIHQEQRQRAATAHYHPWSMQAPSLLPLCSRSFAMAPGLPPPCSAAIPLMLPQYSQQLPRCAQPMPHHHSHTATDAAVCLFPHHDAATPELRDVHPTSGTTAQEAYEAEIRSWKKRLAPLLAYLKLLKYSDGDCPMSPVSSSEL